MKIRLRAMEWWLNKSSSIKTELCIIHGDIIGYDRGWKTLTGREIQMIWEEETKLKK